MLLRKKEKKMKIKIQRRYEILTTFVTNPLHETNGPIKIFNERQVYMSLTLPNGYKII